MPHRIPPHVIWPAAIIALFCAGTLSTLSMIWIAQSDGGVQVIDNYYERAVAWNETAEIQAASDALGWKAELSVGGREGTDRLRGIRLAVLDREGRPVEGLQTSIRVSRPQYAAVLHEADLQPDPMTPGVYRHVLPLDAAGFWDFSFEATRDSALFLTTIRKEILQ